MFNTASNRSKDNLKGINHKLIALVGYALAISDQDFFVNEGLRSTETQQKYFAQKRSKLDGVTKKSQHQLGRAVDVYYTGWKDTDSADDPRWYKLYDAFQKAADALRIKIVIAGRDWTTFKDMPHIELHKSEK